MSAAGLKAAVSCLFVKPGRVGGAQFMVRNVLAGLGAVARPEDVIVAVGPPEVTTGHPGIHPRLRTFRNRFAGDWWMMGALAEESDSLLFPNYFTPPRPHRGARIVTVIHDLNYRHFPAQFSATKRAWLRAAHEVTLRTADSVVVISEFVARDLVEQYGARYAGKLKVIPNPIDWTRFDATPVDAPAVHPEGRFVLGVGAAYVHKNFETLIRAFAVLARRQEDVTLVIAGALAQNLVGVSTAADHATLVEDLGLGDRIRVLGYVDDSVLGGLYRQAELFVFPSLFEGFGMPPVEALGMGVPVITTGKAALPETTLGMAMYVEDPLDISELAASMEAVLDSPERYRPDDPARLRNHYGVERIGAMYYGELIG